MPHAGYLEYYPQLAGRTFGDLAFFFDDGIVIALINRRTGVCTVTPPPETKACSHEPQSESVCSRLVQLLWLYSHLCLKMCRVCRVDDDQISTFKPVLSTCIIRFAQGRKAETRCLALDSLTHTQGVARMNIILHLSWFQVKKNVCTVCTLSTLVMNHVSLMLQTAAPDLII